MEFDYRVRTAAVVLLLTGMLYYMISLQEKHVFLWSISPVTPTNPLK